MPTPGEEVYHNDVIFRALVKHLYKTTLRSVMMMEQKGETFDRCVKELYRDMVYDVIHNMNRDSVSCSLSTLSEWLWSIMYAELKQERAIKYLDAVRTIDANTPRQGTDEQAYVAKLDRDGSLVATLAEVEALRLKCPNLRLITRHDPPAQHPSVTITLKKGESTGTVKLHHRFGKPTMVDPASQLPPEIHDEPWPGWVFEQTSTLWVMPCAERTSYHRTDLEQKLSNIADLSRSYAEVDTANLPMTLDLLTRVVRSRRPDDLPISRISSTVKNFTLDEFSDFIRAAGAELTELELFPWGSCSRLSLLDIPRLCLLVRQSCPKLLTLRLPVSNRRWDSSAPSPWYSMRRIRSDTEGDAPSPTLSFSDGTLQHLGLFLCRWYDVQLDTPRKRKLMSFNFARSLACLLAPGGHLVLMDGDHRPHGKAPWYTLELHHNTWVQVVMSAVAFFHRWVPSSCSW